VNSRPRSAGRGWYHARWIAVNAALIAFLAWLYLHFLIPRYIDQPENRSSESRWETPLEAPLPATTATRARLHHNQQRSRPGRMQQRTPRAAYANPETVAEMGGTCIGGRVFRSKVTKGVTVIKEVVGVRC
jgi:hypothetical protein